MALFAGDWLFGISFLGFSWSKNIQFVFLHLQVPSPYLQISVMASIRKRLSLVLGLNDERSSPTSKATSMNLSRSSIDSGYHSMIAKPKVGCQDIDCQANTFITSGTESSPRKLRKAISSTFSGAMQAFSNTVRSTTSYIYPTAGEPELPSSEWAECETPKKESRRSSIMSSVRSRKRRSTPRASGAKLESPEMLQSPVPVARGKSPALEVEIPNPSLSYESLEKASVCNGSQLLADVKLPAGPKNLWPGPTRLTVEQASGNKRRGFPHNAVSNIGDPYVEQGHKLEDGISFINSSFDFDLEPPSPVPNKRHMGDDKGYLSEVESNAEISEKDGLSPAYLKYVAPGSPEDWASSPCRHEDPATFHVHIAPSANPYERANPSQTSFMPLGLETLDGAAEQTASLEPSNRRLGDQVSSPEDGFNALSLSRGPIITTKTALHNSRLPSDVYNADAETLDSRMGSRDAWDRHRADRERRYMQIVDMASETESDEDTGPELELKRSPPRKPVHSAEEIVQRTVNPKRPESAQGSPPSDLRYAVEAIERSAFPVGDLAYAVEAIERSAFPVGDLAYAVEAIDRPSVKTFDSLETVFQQRPMLRLTDMVAEPETLQISEPMYLSPSRVEASSSPLANLSPSRVELPSSPESFPVEVPAPRKLTTTMTRSTDELRMTLGVDNLEDGSIRQVSSDSIDVSAKCSPEHRPHTPPENVYEGLIAGGFSVPTYLSGSSTTWPVGVDVYEAGFRAAGISLPMYPPDIVQNGSVVGSFDEAEVNVTPTLSPVVKETSHGTYREKLEIGSTLPKQRSWNGYPFRHNPTVSAFSDDTDDSCAITIHSPSCNAPPPFPSLHVRSEPACRISSALDTLAAYGDEKIRIAGPANAGMIPSLPSPFDEPGERINQGGFTVPFPTASDGADSPENRASAMSLEQRDLQSPSPGTLSSKQSRSSRNTPQEAFNAAKLLSFGSPSPIASWKARRNQKKSSSGMGNYPSANRTINATDLTLEPDFTLSRLEPKKSSVPEVTQMPLGRSPRTARGSAQERSPNCQISKKSRRSRDQPSLELDAEVVGDSVGWSDLSSDSNSSNKSPYGKGRKSATLSVTSSPPRMKMPRAGVETSSEQVRGNAESAVKDSKSRLEPEFSIKHFDSMRNILTPDASGRLSGTSYPGHELDSVTQADSLGYCGQRLNEDLHQDNEKKATRSASGDETVGKCSESHKDTPRTPGQKKNGKPPAEAEKKFAVQRELERKSDRACSRLAGKLKSRALADDHVREDGLTHQYGRPPWRP